MLCGFMCVIGSDHTILFLAKISSFTVVCMYVFFIILF